MFYFNLFLLSNLDFLQNCCRGGIHIRTTIQLGFTDVDDHDKDNNNKDIKDNYDNNKVYYIKEHDCKDDHKDDTKTISIKFILTFFFSFSFWYKCFFPHSLRGWLVLRMRHFNRLSDKLTQTSRNVVSWVEIS